MSWKRYTPPLVICGMPSTNMKTTMQAVNWRRRGRRNLGQLSTRPQMRDSRMQN